MTMHLQISLSPSEGNPRDDADLLRSIADALEGKTSWPHTTPAPKSETADEPADRLEAAVRENVQPAPAAKDEKPAEEPAEPAPAAETVEPAEEPAPADGKTVKQALDAAREVLSLDPDKGKNRVRAALKHVGADRVTELTADQVPGFLDKLK